MGGGSGRPALPAAAPDQERAERYEAVLDDVKLALQDEDDWVAAMATVACELHAAFEHFHWTGFYRASLPETLVVGPYQGGHGCLRIPLARGVCGKAARTKRTQLVPDVHAFPGHIACASSTQSEIVVPIVSAQDGALLGVLDVDSDLPAAFNEVDGLWLERLAAWLGGRAWRHCP